jgi:hypothetical protein
MWTIVSLIILPLLSFVGGILGLKSDPKEAAKKKLVIFILVFSAIASIAISISRHQSDVAQRQAADAQKKRDDANIDYLMKGTDDIKGLLARFLAGSGVAQARVENIREKGLSSSDVQLVQMGITGDDLLKTLLSPVQAENQKQQTRVVYYPKDVDPRDVNGPALLASLKQAGFEVTPSLVGRRNPNLATNAIWAADDVPIEQVKFVAYTLMRAGVEIRAIRTFSGSGRKPHQIEIGADAAIVGLPPLTFDKIQEMQSLSRDTN